MTGADQSTVDDTLAYTREQLLAMLTSYTLGDEYAALTLALSAVKALEAAMGRLGYLERLADGCDQTGRAENVDDHCCQATAEAFRIAATEIRSGSCTGARQSPALSDSQDHR